MINYFFKYKIKSTQSLSPSDSDIEKSKKILFSIFTRYGDTIISLVVIKDFIIKFPDKEYLIICSHQMKPYVKELLPNIRCEVLKKRNVFNFFKIRKILKNGDFDIGFNPWSFGLESCCLLTYCNSYLLYKDFKKPSQINHYEVVRKYLHLDLKDWSIENLKMRDNYKKILICPQSTDKNRSISSNQLDQILIKFNKKYIDPEITIAAMDITYFRLNYNQFLFKKSYHSSECFIDLVKKSELIICSDSGPLHIANALNKSVIAFFNVTNPEFVINSGDILKLND